MKKDKFIEEITERFEEDCFYISPVEIGYIADMMIEMELVSEETLPVGRPLTKFDKVYNNLNKQLGKFCSCSEPSLIKNCAGGNTFEFCSACKKEKI